MFARGAACLLLSVACATGCGYLRKVGDCRRLANHVNRALTEISAARDAGGATAETYRDLSARYERLAHEVEIGVRTDDARGKTLREYSQSFRETSRALTALAFALEQKDEAGITRLERELATLARRDKTLVSRLDALCAEP
jgi:hypothetical protein